MGKLLRIPGIIWSGLKLIAVAAWKIATGQTIPKD
jgi:hypothetical protein